MSANTGSYPLLDSTALRTKWANMLVYWSKGESKFMKLEGNGRTKGNVTYVSKDVAAETFYVEAVGNVHGAPVPDIVDLGGAATYQIYKANTYKRCSMAMAVKMNKITKSRTPRDIVADATRGLSSHWALTYDKMMVAAASALNTWDGIEDDADKQTTTRTAAVDATTQAALGYALDPHDASNMSDLALILDQASIGTDNVSKGTHKNVWFAGAGADGGPRTNPPASSWSDAIADPKSYLPTVASLQGLEEYMSSRGVPGLNVDAGGFTPEGYILYLPKEAIYQLRRDPDYTKAVYAGDVRAEEMWKNTMPFHMIGGIMLQPCNWTGTDMTYNTPLRATISSDSKYLVVECLAFGAQAMAISAYDEFQILTDNDDDFGRSPKIGYDIIKGAGKIKRIKGSSSGTSADTKQYNNVCSFICTVPMFS